MNALPRPIGIPAQAWAQVVWPQNKDDAPLLAPLQQTLCRATATLAAEMGEGWLATLALPPAVGDVEVMAAARTRHRKDCAHRLLPFVPQLAAAPIDREALAARAASFLSALALWQQAGRPA